MLILTYESARSRKVWTREKDCDINKFEKLYFSIEEWERELILPVTVDWFSVHLCFDAI